MAVDPYASCPCGSGKKFKWCCQPFQAEFEAAFKQHNNGQPDVALQTLEAATRAHASNPMVWGRYAQLLHVNERTEDAEAALAKGFEVSPDFAFGYYLRGLFRQQEGEAQGATLLFRKSAETYPPEAVAQLTELYGMIGQNELRYNRILAAREALVRALRYDPQNEELQQLIYAYFGPHSRFPDLAKQEYTLKATAHPVDLPTDKLSAYVKTFAAYTAEHPTDASGWYNLAVARAWVGEHNKAIAALEKYVELESDEVAAGEGWALAEVLTCSIGVDGANDYVEHRAIFRVRDPQPVMAQLQAWSQAGRFLPMNNPQEDQVLNALVVEPLQTLISSTGPQFGKLIAHVFIAGDGMSLSHPSKDNVEKLLNEVRGNIGMAVTEPKFETGPMAFGDVAVDAMLFPTRSATPEQVEPKMRAQARTYFEDVWITLPRRALGGQSPTQAVATPLLRKKLRGVLRFTEECFRGNAPRKVSGEHSEPMHLYDFADLRAKLGLDAGTPAPAALTAAPVPAGPDVSSLGVAELSALTPAALSANTLEQAFAAALGHDDKALASTFAQALVQKPTDGSTDRYRYFTHLIQQASEAKDYPTALRLLDAALATDATANESKRQNDYDLRKGQLLIRSGDVAGGATVFTALIDRVPSELRYRIAATEAMLGVKDGTRAKTFADAGLAAARAQKNRDAEQNFLELLNAAKRFGA